jgi:hypothetical protein
MIMSDALVYLNNSGGCMIKTVKDTYICDEFTNMDTIIKADEARIIGVGGNDLIKPLILTKQHIIAIEGYEPNK